MKHGRYNIIPAHHLSGSESSNSEPPIPTSRLPGQVRTGPHVGHPPTSDRLQPESQ